MNGTRRRPLIAVTIAAALPTAGSALGDEIVLRASVRLAADAQVVRLADISELSGPEATRHADVIVASLSNPTSATEISVENIRESLTQAGAHWGRLNLTGAKVIVRPRRSPDSSAPLAMMPATISGAAEPAPSSEPRDPRPDLLENAPLASTMINERSLRGAVVQLLVERLRRSPDEVKLAFLADDEPTLSTPATDYRFEFEPLSAVDGDRIELAVRFWTKGTVQSRHQLTVRPLVRATAVAAARDIDRGQSIDPSDIVEETQWLAPRLAASQPQARATAGMIAARRVKAGDVIGRADLKPAVIVRRGDRVVVRCLVGGVAIAMQAEAAQDGSRGEPINLRKIGERSEFVATVSGPGEAVVDLRR